MSEKWSVNPAPSPALPKIEKEKEYQGEGIISYSMFSKDHKRTNKITTLLLCVKSGEQYCDASSVEK